MAAETGGKIDPMHQFLIEPAFGEHRWVVGGLDLTFTNSALWMVLTLGSLWLFVLLGSRRELVPGRWQMAVESFTGFIQNMLTSNIGPEGKRFVPYVFSLFMFILFAKVPTAPEMAQVAMSARAAARRSRWRANSAWA